VPGTAVFCNHDALLQINHTRREPPNFSWRDVSKGESSYEDRDLICFRHSFAQRLVLRGGSSVGPEQRE
jgi:hypothetical protein